MAATQDRRVRRTKQAIRGAFIDLALAKGFDSVTIEDIVSAADLSRATFYSHYKDKDALLKGFLSELSEERSRLLPAIEEESPRGFTGLPVQYLFNHVANQRDAYKVILRGEGNGRALRELTAFLVDIAEETFSRRAEKLGIQPRLPLDFIARTWAGEIIAVLTWWVDEESPYDEQQLAQFLRDLAVGGRVWASGVGDL